MSHTQDLANQLSQLLEPDLGPLGFKYFKSRTRLERKKGEITDSITIDVVTHDRRTYDIAFYINVQHVDLEKLIAKIENVPIMILRFTNILTT